MESRNALGGICSGSGAGRPAARGADHGGAAMPPAAHGGPHVGAGGCPYFSSLFNKLYLVP